MPRGKKSNQPTMTKREARRSIKELYWFDQIEAYRNSGQSAKDWCLENNVNYHTLTSWITKLNLQQRTAVKPSEIENDWVEPEETAIDDPADVVEHNTSTDVTSTPIIKNEPGSTLVITHGAITISAGPGYDKNILMELLQVLLGQAGNSTQININ